MFELGLFIPVPCVELTSKADDGDTIGLGLLPVVDPVVPVVPELDDDGVL